MSAQYSNETLRRIWRTPVHDPKPPSALQTLERPVLRLGQPVIPLDTEDPTFNVWKQLRDFSKDRKREPGPNNAHANQNPSAVPPIVLRAIQDWLAV